MENGPLVSERFDNQDDRPRGKCRARGDGTISGFEVVGGLVAGLGMEDTVVAKGRCSRQASCCCLGCSGRDEKARDDQQRRMGLLGGKIFDWRRMCSGYWGFGTRPSVCMIVCECM